MNVDKVKLIAHNLKLLAESLEDAIKEDPDSYLKSDVDPKTGLWKSPKPYTYKDCLLYTSPSPRDRTRSRMPSSA